MKRLMVIGLALLAGGLAAGAAAADEPPQIAVVGRGTASHAADVATLSYTIHGEGKTQVDALRQLAATRSAVETALSQLAGAAVRLQAQKVSVVAARGSGCNDEARGDLPSYLAAGPCAVVGYIAEVEGAAVVQPADQAGNAASLAAEKGATDVQLSDATITDEKALTDAAAAAAIQDAQRQAATIAAASGVKLGPIVRIQDNDAQTDSSRTELTVTAEKREARLSPSVQIGYKPPPVTRSATFTVVYSIVR